MPLPRRSTLRRASPLAAIAGAAALTTLVAPSAAFGQSVTSPTGMLAVSVPTPVFAGPAATYTVTLTNPSSTQQLIGTSLEGVFPSGMTLTKLGGCSRIGGNQTDGVECIMPTLAPGASEIATLGLLASTTGTFAIPLSVAGGIPVPNEPGTLQIVGDSATITVIAQPGPTDIQVTGSTNNGSPPVGTTFTYTFQVKDNGPLPASGVTFDDTLPTAIVLGSSLTASIGTCTASAAANSVHCDLGNLGVGQQSVISYTASPTATGTFPDTATIAMVGPSTQPAHESVTVTVQPK
jgi:uncharacterized repeat protein (TIGR01451 family)